MARFIPLCLLLCLLSAPTLAEDPPAPEKITWRKDLTVAMAEAKKKKRILMVCVNAKFVDGKTTEESAAKGLREVVYKDPRVVKASVPFVCVLLTPKSDAGDYAELSNLGIEGRMISPQHIFINAAGDRILLRREYWRYGQGEKAVKALLAMMEKAKERAKNPGTSDADAKAEAEGAPKEGEARKKWIEEKLKLVRGTVEEREAALKALVKADKDGDCTNPLIALLPEYKKKAEILNDLIRALGVPGLMTAAEPISKFLRHKVETVRANAAVSLEYIGPGEKKPTAKIITALMKAAGKEKDQAIANHLYRALGRCGLKNSKVRGLLLKMAGSAKSEFASFGPLIGLAYFEEDEKAMRGVEKLLKQVGVPGGRRGAGANTIKRAVLSWTLAAIGDEKSEKFVREVLMAGLKNTKAFWVTGLLRFWESVAKTCGGAQDELAAVAGGVRVIVGFASEFGGGTNSLMDDARKRRDTSEFKPKGDNLLGLQDGD